MDRIRFVFLSIGLFFSCLTIAQQVHIKGEATDFPNKVIRLKVQTDLISARELVLDKDTVAPDGSFELSADFQEITYAVLEIDNVRSSLYVLPSTNYQLRISPKKDILNGQNEMRLKSFVPLEMYAIIDEPSGEELNYYIRRIDDAFYAFVSARVVDLMYKRNKHLTEELGLVFDTLVKGYSDPYLENYIHYKLAGLKMMQRLHNNKNFVSLYFHHKPVLYNNPEYMYVFNQFFSKHIVHLSLTNLRDSIMIAINKEKDYFKLNKLIARDSLLLPNDTLRELVMIKGLYEAYFDKDFSKDGVLQLLHYIANNSHIPKHRELTNSVLLKLAHLRKNTKAPDFCLPDLEGMPHCLNDFKGKLLCVNFWAPWSIYSIEEMKMADSIQLAFDDQVTFVNIAVDDDRQEIQEFIKDYRLTSPNILQDAYKEIAFLYGVEGVPTYVLIDADGLIINAYSPKPSEGLESYIRDIIKKSNTTH